MNVRLLTLVGAACALAGLISGCVGDRITGPGGAHPELQRLNWLVGDWSTEPDENGESFEEHWMAPRRQEMFGIGRTLRDGRERFVEYLRIAVDVDGVVYHAAPGGRLPATPFRAVEYGPRRAVFENPEHDFPQRIHYELLADGRMRVRIGADVNGTLKTSEWLLQPVR